MKHKLLFMMATLLSTTTGWAIVGDRFNADQLEYQITSEDLLTVWVVGNSGTQKDVIIPDQVTNNSTTYNVTGIADGAFSDCEILRTITIPASVAYIGSDACWGSLKLRSITVQDGNECYMSLDGVLFNKAGISLLIYPSGKSIPSYTVPDGVTTIGDGAFADCRSLTSITLPASVTSIGQVAFYNCENLSSIIIPAGVTTIGESAFFQCEKLTSVSFADSSQLTGIGEMTFFGCSNLSSLIIPASVTTIGQSAFSSCRNLSKLIIPASVTTIGGGAFSGCGQLTTMTIPAGVTSIGNNPFENCLKLTSITVETGNENYMSIDGVLFDKAGITLISYPTGKSEDSYTIPASVTSIGDRAFRACFRLSSITIPDGVTSIGQFAFSGCSNLSSLDFPAGVTSIPKGVLSSCSNLRSFTVPAGVTSIGERAFHACNNLSSITIPAGVTSIGKEAFYDCYNLSSLIIPSGVTTIGQSAFAFSGLNLVTIPSSVTFIGNGAFSRCIHITDVICYANLEALTWSSNAYSFKPNKKTLFHVTGNVTEWERMWPDANVTFVDDLEDFFLVDNLWYKIANSGVHSVLNSTIDEQKKQSLNMVDLIGYLTPPINELEIPASVNHDGEDYIVTSLGDNVFVNCSALTSVNIPEGVKSLGDNVFVNCSALTSVNIPEGVKSLGDNVFANCSALTSVNIPASVMSIGKYAFTNCSALTSVMIPAGVTTIGDSTFCHCEHLASINIPAGVTSIGKYAFWCCDQLKSIVIPASVTTISEMAFTNCVNVTDVYCNADPAALTWLDIYGFMNDKTTKCHVYNKAAFEAKWATGDACTDLNVTFVGDLEDFFVVDHLIYKITNGNENSARSFETSRHKAEDVTENTVELVGYEALPTGFLYIPSVVSHDGVDYAVTSIGGGSFCQCNILTSVSIPYSVTNIEGDAFQSCTGITDVYCYADPTQLTWTPVGMNFSGPDEETKFHVEYASAWEQKFSDLNVTFIDDLDEIDAIDGITPSFSEGDSAWYTLSGMKLEGEPTEKGIYVKDGRKVVHGKQN